MQFDRAQGHDVGADDTDQAFLTRAFQAAGVADVEPLRLEFRDRRACHPTRFAHPAAEDLVVDLAGGRASIHQEPTVVAPKPQMDMRPQVPGQFERDAPGEVLRRGRKGAAVSQKNHDGSDR
jgi:hypothetical protein